MNDALPSTSMAPIGRGETAVTLPSQFTITRSPGVYALSWRWREQVQRRHFLGLTGLLPLMGQLMAQLPHLVRIPAIGIPVLSLLALLVAAFVYGALSWANNTVTLRVAHGLLTQTSRPLPSPWQKKIEVAPDTVFVVIADGAIKKVPTFAVAVSTAKAPRALVHRLSREQAELIVSQLNAAVRGPS